MYKHGYIYTIVARNSSQLATIVARNWLFFLKIQLATIVARD